MIQQTESKLCEMVKSVEVQIEKHEKALTSLINDHKTAQSSSFSTPSPWPTSPITEESVASIAASITSGQNEKRKGS